jgi:ABC-type multidrug transport system ATPase subunit
MKDKGTGADVEGNHKISNHLMNNLVDDFSWKDLTVKVKDRGTKKVIDILSNSSGVVRAGEMLAIMGPSGSGKTTLLNALAHRQAAAKSTTTGDMFANGQKMNLRKMRELSTYVEQEDALIGSLTVRETMRFAVGLALPA